MAQKIIIFAIIQAIAFQMAFSQVIRSFGGCGCGGGCGCSNIFPIGEQIISPYLPGPYLSAPSPVVYDQPTTIIQDSTVANNLANALQLLVVSNLLSSTLPLEQPAPLAVATPNLASLELLNAPFALSPSLVAPFSPCGCGGCGCNNCGFSPYNVVY